MTEQIVNQVIELAKNVGTFILHEHNKLRNSDIQTKGEHDFVTYVDKNSEKKLVEGLKKILPEAGFITEEKTEKTEQKEFMWIIDPLDGTTNYIHNLSPFAISIALQKKSKTILGVVYVVSENEMFYATEKGAFLNGKQISVTQKNNIEDALIATGFPYYNYSRLASFMQTLEYFMKHSHGLRRLGSAATDLVYVACGRFEAFYEYGLNPWDVAAGAYIVEQAGGKVADFSGKNNYIFGKEIIASNSEVYTDFLQIIKKFYQA